MKILEKMVRFTGFRRIMSLRLICKEWDQILKTSPRFLDSCKYVIHDAAALERFANSDVQWKRVVLGYWPQPFDRFPRGVNTYKLWEDKAPHIIELSYKMQPYVRISCYSLYEILLPLENLESLMIASSLSQFNLNQDLGQGGRLMLRYTLAHLKHFEVDDLLYDNYYYRHNFPIHIENCYYLLKLVPPRQLETFHVSASKVFGNEFAYGLPGLSKFLSNFITDSIKDHIPSLKHFRYDHAISPVTLEEISNMELLQLESLSLNFLSTMTVLEKSKLDQASPSLSQYFQVKAWRSFQQFLRRQQHLNKFQMYIRDMNKKIAKQMYPNNIHETVKTLILCVDECENEESLRFLSKFVSLKDLTLDISNFDAVEQQPKSNFFPMLPSTLENIMLVSIAYPPRYLIDLVRRLSKLRIFRVYNGSSMLTDASVQAILQHLPDLRELTLAPAYKVSDAAFLGKSETSRNTYTTGKNLIFLNCQELLAIQTQLFCITFLQNYVDSC